VVAVVKVNETVSCMAQVNFYHPPLSLMYAEVNLHMLYILVGIYYIRHKIILGLLYIQNTGIAYQTICYYWQK
jgi:hypothetical protein